MSFPNASCISLIKYLLFCHECHQVPSYELIKVKNYFVRRYVRYKMPYHDNFFFFHLRSTMAWLYTQRYIPQLSRSPETNRAGRGVISESHILNATSSQSRLKL